MKDIMFCHGSFYSNAILGGHCFYYFVYCYITIVQWWPRFCKHYFIG